jgi:agmatine deiminase
MLADKNTNIVYIADTLRTLRTDVYNRLTKLLSDIGIDVRLLYGTKDIWCRDYMPIQVDRSLFVKFHYAPDYMWSIPKYKNDITDCSDICKSLGIKYKETDLIIDGRNIVLCGDKVVMTDKVFTENRYKKGDQHMLDKLSINYPNFSSMRS